jgi:hypothetical protein
LITKIYRELKKLNSKNTNDPTRNGQMNWTEHFQRKKSKRLKKKHMKKCSISLAIKEM